MVKRSKGHSVEQPARRPNVEQLALFQEQAYRNLEQQKNSGIDGVSEQIMHDIIGDAAKEVVEIVTTKGALGSIETKNLLSQKIKERLEAIKQAPKEPTKKEKIIKALQEMQTNPEAAKMKAEAAEFERQRQQREDDKIGNADEDRSLYGIYTDHPGKPRKR